MAVFMLAATYNCCAATYYVATTGSDSNFGTLTAPFATVNRAITAMVPGDTAYIRGGTYAQAISASKSGAANLPITIAGYPGEVAVIDGGGTIPSGDGTYPLVSVTASYVTVQDLTIQNAYGTGLQIAGSWDQAIRIKSYRNWSSGIRVTSGSNNSVVDSEIYWNARSNDRSAGNVAQYWGAGLTCNRGGVNNTAFRRNKIWNNWGEGLSTFESTYTTLESNISWDNFANNIYLSDTQHALVQRNLAYYTPGNVTSSGAQTNIEMGDETSNPPSSDNVVINNFAVGGTRVFSCCTGATNNVISNNSFINAYSGAVANVQIWSSGTYTNAQFVNNIIEQDDSVPITSFASNPTGLTRSNNAWSKTPSASASGSGDIIGDPRLSKSGSTSPGSYSPDWFKLLSDSPAIHHAFSLSQVAVDFFLNPRGTTPDIGGDQFVANGDTVPPSVPAGLAASVVSSTQINLSWLASTDNAGVTGYRVYRNGVQINTATGTAYQDSGLNGSTTYSYTVAAYDAAGNLSAQSGPASATTTGAPDQTPPTTPTGLGAAVISSSQINLTWVVSTDNVGVVGYRVYRGGTQIATVNGTSFQNTGLTASTTYSYTVAAYDAAGNVSPQSAPAAATTQPAPDQTPPSIPTGLTGSAISSSQINLSWVASTDNVGVTGYRVYRNGAQVATVGNTSFQDAGLTASTTYSYGVAAYDAAGNVSAQSAPVSVSTLPVSVSGNLALKRAAYASSIQSSSFPATAAFDGSGATRWSSAYSDPQWIYVDLGATYSISRVVLNWEYAYGKVYQIQVSTDGSTWTTVYTQTAGTGGIETLTFAPANARYVRMYGSQRGTPFGYSLWEMQVYAQ